MATKEKPYRAKTLSGAQTYVRMLLKSRRQIIELLERYAVERKQMAMLAADGPAFTNPLQAMAAKLVRDEILRSECRMNPDGSPLTR
jgi:hypothetical protein